MDSRKFICFIFLYFVFYPKMVGADLPVRDGDFGCLSSTQADQYVRDFHINTRSFGGLELCQSNVDTKKLFNDLQIIEQGRFAGSNKNIFIQNFVDANNYYGWARNQTSGIRRGQDIPTATAYNSGGYFTMQDGWARLSTLGRVGVLIHEARHTEGYYHVPCDQGPYKGSSMDGCDGSLSEGGSHAVEMEYYSRVVLQGQNFHPLYRQMARLMALARANFVFNELAMNQSEILVGLYGDGLVLLDNQGKILTHTWPPGELAQNFDLKRTSFGVSLYQGQQAFAVDLYNGSASPLTDEFSYYKLLKDNRIQNLADMQEVDIANRRYLVALTLSGQLYTFIYAEGRWSAPVSASDVVKIVTTAPDGRDGLFVVTKNQDVYSLHPQTLRRETKVGTWDPQTVGYVKWGNSVLNINSLGDVLESGQIYSPLASYKVKALVHAPFYDAFHLDETQIP